MIAKNFGEIPAAGELTAEDQALLDHVEAAFGVVGDLIGRHRQKAAIGEAMRAVAEVNKYVSDSEPWKLKGDDERERLGTILHVVAQCVADLNTILSPFLPFSANAVARGARRHGRGAADARAARRSTTSTAGPATRSSPATTPAPPAGSACPIAVGTPVAKPAPVFTKLDPAVVDEELARLTSMTRRDVRAAVLRPAAADHDGQPLRDQRGQPRRLAGDGCWRVAQQKRMALKEQVTFYADEGRTQPVFSFQARR